MKNYYAFCNNNLLYLFAITYNAILQWQMTRTFYNGQLLCLSVMTTYYIFLEKQPTSGHFVLIINHALLSWNVIRSFTMTSYYALLPDKLLAFLPWQATIPYYHDKLLCPFTMTSYYILLSWQATMPFYMTSYYALLP